MRGKIVNLCMGCMNILLGILLIVYMQKVPQDKILLTIQEKTVIEYVLLSIYAITIIVAFINIIQSYHHRSDSTFKTGYLIGIISVVFIFFKSPIIGFISLFSGLIILIKTIKENLVELNSTTAISVSIVMIAVILGTTFAAYTYSSLGQAIKNKENKNEITYKKDYFKYITELEINEPYINVKKDGKFGYINPRGETVIPYKYDYASPFVQITAFNKNFHIALVCENGSTYIILKNGRVVMSYRTETADENYDKKLEELEKIYKEVLAQTDKMEFEITQVNGKQSKAPVYQNDEGDYTYRYDYNDEYDILITTSSLGRNDKYEFAKKENLDIRMLINTTYLDYDENYLYLFSNKTIPFYEPSKKNQGWYTSVGQKVEIKGNAQILELIGQNILIKNCGTNEIYFSDNTGKKLSETYKDIYICDEEKYIVKDESGYMKIINNQYDPLFEKQYATINPRLERQKIYLVLDTTENIKFNEYKYAKMKWKLINENGEVLLEDIEAIYDLNLKLPTEKLLFEENYMEFEKNLKELHYDFVGDKYYKK